MDTVTKKRRSRQPTNSASATAKDSDTLAQSPKKRGRKPHGVTPKTVRCPTKRVYICSPLRGSIERNIERARIYCRFAFDSGYVPICPQIFYTQFLNDNDKTERAAGMRYALESLWLARQLWVFGEDITDGMRDEITLAKQLKIPVRYFDADMEEVK